MTDEDVSRRTIALSMRTGKLTARGLAYALRAAGRKIQKEYRAHQTPHGRQSVKKLMAHGAATNSIELTGAPKEFDRVARKWNVDYAFYKTGPDKYLLFFKSGQADAIVKDLSRFARNYSDAGSLIDNLFVQMGVRFISLAENVDSFKDPDSVSNIIVPITNVMNDNYCYQTSKKIRQVFDYKRRNGQYIGSFAPYGYVKHPKDKHQLIVDPEAADTVKRIYSMFLQGTAKRAIALYLNEHGFPSPTAYRRIKGLPVSSAVADDPMWGARMIHEVLTNPIYTGDLVQGRRRVKSYKVHQIEAVPEEEWVRVPNTHETIIEHEVFDRLPCAGL